MPDRPSDAPRAEKGFRKLIVWQKAHASALSVYNLTEKFPKAEIYELNSQLHRTAVSVPVNIAEGYGRGWGQAGQIGCYLDIAKGSLSEVEYYLILASDLKYITEAEYNQAENLRTEVGYLLFRLNAKVRQPKS